MAYEITYSQLTAKNELPDADVVEVAVAPNVCPADQIQLGLQLRPDIWWKGLYLDDTLVIDRRDTTNPAFAQIPLTEFRARLFHMWKAKFLGSYQDVYIVTDATAAMQGGNRYTFTWIWDGQGAIIITG